MCTSFMLLPALFFAIFFFFCAETAVYARPAAGQPLGYHLRAVKGGVEVKTGVPTTDPALFQRTFIAADIRIDGVFPLVRLRVDQLIAEKRSRRLSIADAFNLAKAVEDAHKALGYSLARVVVPDQVLGTSGRFALRVVDVRVHDVDGKDMPVPMVDRLRQRAAVLVGKPMPTSTDLSTLVGRTQYEFGRDLSIDTREVDQSDQVGLVLKGPTKQVFSEISANTFLSKPFDVTTVGAATSVFDALNLGERLTVAGSWARENDAPATRGPLWSFAAGATLPMDVNGPNFWEFNGSTARIKLDTPGQSTAAYTATRASLFYAVPLFYGSDESIIFRAGPSFTTEKESYTLFYGNSQSFAIDVPYTTLEFQGGINWVRRLDHDIKIDAGGEVELGSSRSLDLDALSTLGSATKPIGHAEVHARVDIPLMLGTVLSPYGRAGISFLSPLPPSDQLQLFQSVAPIPVDPRTIQGDSGAFLRTELARAFTFPVADRPITLQPYLFAAAGIVYEQESFFTVAGHVTGDQFGAGLRMTIAPHDHDVPVIEGSVEFCRQNTTAIEVPNYSAATLAMRARF